jgi:hypothetical protein
MKLVLVFALTLAASTIAVAQHQQGNVTNVPDQKFDAAAHCACLADGHGCQHPESDTKSACELVGGTWVEPTPTPEFPKVVSAQLILDPVQAAHLENEWIKQCGPSNHANSCFDPTFMTVVSSDVHVDNNVPGAVYVNSQTGRVVKLSDEEYARLQKLRQAVADEEKKIAAAHGVDFGQVYVPAPCTFYDMGCTEWDKTKEVQSRPADHWKFRGQWLFINVP